MTDEKTSPLNSPFYLGLVRLANQAAALMVFLLGARFLSIDEIGTFALASALSMLLAQLAWVGFHQYALREKLEEKNAGNLLAVCLGTSVLLAAFTAGISYPSALLFGQPEIYTLMLWWSGIPIATGFQAIIIAILYNSNRFKNVAQVIIVTEVLGLAVASFGFIQGWGLNSLLVHRLFVSFFPVVLFLFCLQEKISLDASWQNVGRITKFVSSFTGSHIVNFAGTYGADIILGLMVGPAATGAYRFGARIVLVLAALIDQPLTTLGWTELAKKRNNRHELGRLTDNFLSISMLVSVASFVGLAIVAEPFIIGIVGEKWTISVVVVQILALVYAIRLPLEVTLQPALGVIGQEWWLPVVSVLTTIVSIAAVLVLAPFGIEAAAGSQVIVLAVLIPLSTYLLSRYVNLSVFSLIKSFVTSAVCAALMWAGTHLTMVVLHPFYELVQLVVIVPVGALIFISAVLLFSPAGIKELIQIFQKTYATEKP